MSRHERLLRTILRGQSEANVRFRELRALILHLGFEERVRASHHVYRRAGIAEKINLQNDGGNAKPYQVRQVRRLVLKYRLEEEG